MGTFSYILYIMGMKIKKQKGTQVDKNLETILDKAPCADLQCEDVRYDSVTNYLSDTSEILSWYTEDGHDWNIKHVEDMYGKQTALEYAKEYKELKKHIAYVRRSA